MPSIRDSLSQLIGRASGQLLAGPGTLPRLAEVGFALLRQLIVTVAPLDTAGPEKKQLVLDALGAWYDRVIPSLTIPWPLWLAWLDLLRPVLRPWLKGLLLEIAGQALEAILSDLKDQGKV